MSGKRTVVVTGMGMVSPFGLGGFRESWISLISGKSAITKNTDPETAVYTSAIARCPDDVDLNYAWGNFDSNFKKYQRHTKLALLATKQALIDAKLFNPHDQRVQHNSKLSRASIFLGAGMPPFQFINSQYLRLMGKKKISPRLISDSLANSPAGAISRIFEVNGGLHVPAVACSSGSAAIGEAMRSIRHGYIDIAICGGTESALDPLTIAGFHSSRALYGTDIGLDKKDVITDHYTGSKFQKDQINPAFASRPFSVDRNGFIIGEGAGILVLEASETLEKRGTPTHAIIKGYGMASDAFHPTSPDPFGKGAFLSMSSALKDSRDDLGILPKISFITAHATSTKSGDQAEAEAIKKLFINTPIFAPKASFGHLLAAAGSVEIIMTIEALKEGIVPMTLNSSDQHLVNVRPFLRNITDQGSALCNSFGFGGACSSLVVSRCLSRVT